jgi:hypothetical protein
VYIREGIDLVLAHYGHLLPGQLQLDGRPLSLPTSTTTERSERGSAERGEDVDDVVRPSSGQTSLSGHAHAAAAAKK